MAKLKLLLHPIIRVYTCKWATNIIEKYERSLVVGYQRFARANKVCSPNKNVTTLISKSVTSYRLYTMYSGFLYMQGTCECITRHMQTLQVNGENLQH